MPDRSHKLENLLRQATEYEIILPRRRDPRDEPWCVSYWNEWLAEPEKTEQAVLPYTRALLAAFEDASYAWDFEAMRRILGILDYGFKYCQYEPFRTRYEYILLNIFSYVADWHLILGNLEACLNDITRIEDCLKEGDARREALGIQYRPSSELRYALVGMRAACMCDPYASAKPDVNEARGLCQDFWRIVDALVERLKVLSEEQRANHLANSAQREMEICKLAYITDPALFSEAQGRFNQRYAADLDVGDCRESYPEGLQTAWYWDMEVWKHLHAEPQNTVALHECMRRRNLTQQLQFGKLPQRCLSRFWNRQASAA
jgi:hypothetical protein